MLHLSPEQVSLFLVDIAADPTLARASVCPPPSLSATICVPSVFSTPIRIADKHSRKRDPSPLHVRPTSHFTL